MKNIINLFSASSKSHVRPKRSLKAWRTPHLRMGYLAERKACAYLQTRGLTVIERNYWSSRGELDLIARDRNEIVFIEVKFRSSHSFSPPEDSVNRKKRNTIRTVAREYIRKKDLDRDACRFDIIAITQLSFWKKADIRWIKNAF